MNRPVVKSSVEARLSDKSIKVREAVLDLVGKHIVARQSLASEYYEIIQGRLQDKGVSVRCYLVGTREHLSLSLSVFPYFANLRLITLSLSLSLSLPLFSLFNHKKKIGTKKSCKDTSKHFNLSTQTSQTRRHMHVSVESLR